MKYHIFIDESGAFDEGLAPHSQKRPSVVGGVCSTLDANAWAQSHTLAVDAFNDSCQIQFAYPKHFHAAPLLAGRIQVAGPVRREHLRACYSAIRDNIMRNTAFAFVSVNAAGHFEYSPQATYVLNLVTALRAAFDHLAKMPAQVDACRVVVAQRTIRETADLPPDDYMATLLDFVQAQLQVGDTPGAVLARSVMKSSALGMLSTVGARDGGAIAADFICFAARFDSTPPAGLVTTKPGADNIVDYRAFYRAEIVRLLEAQQYAAAADFSRRYLPDIDGKSDLQPVLARLRSEADFRVLRRELPALAAIAEAMIESRTRDSKALPAALALLQSLDSAAQRALTAPGDPLVQRQWSDIQAYVLMLLASCHNHMGAVAPQDAIETRINDFLAAPAASGSKTYVEKRELLLQAKTRAVNRLFNNYQFEAVLTAIQPVLAEREKAIPTGTADELLGQMLGTVGQACAFIARTDSEMAIMARDYFEQSLVHFAPGTQYHAMSVNFLATLAWQEGNMQLACKEMSRHSRIPDPLSPETVVNDFEKLLAGHISPFDAVNLCRIAAATALAGNPPNLSAIASAWDLWSGRLVDAHPHEQLCKWLGFLALCCGDHAFAMQMLERGRRISETLGFTVETIWLSIIGLAAVTAGAQGDNAQYAQSLNRFRDSVTDLLPQSTPFAAYIANVGGCDGLVATIKTRNMSAAWKISTFLPFNYA